MTFADLGIDSDLVDALAARGIVEPFPIQAQTIPLGLSGQDIIGQAKTGTGKTLGFGLPIIQRLGHDPEPGVQVLVVVPTRELCVQVAEDLVMATSNRPTTVAAIYGGKAYEGQVEQLKAGAQIVVGTPGRLLDLAGQRLLSLSSVREMVLDEADKMLDLGFLPDIEKLFAQTPADRHTMLFSATMPGPIVALARRFMNRPVHIRATDPDEGLTQANIRHVVYRTHALDKDEVIARILQAEGRGKTVIFTRTKRAAAKLVDELGERGFAAAAVHGDLSQEQRERAMNSFRSGKKDVLIATDVAARGIDVDDVTHVINHTLPEDADAYLHRAGRTGRAGKTGIAVTFVDWDDLHKWALIDRALDFGKPEPVETYSSSPHLYTDLDIPEGTKGRIVPRPVAAAQAPEAAAGEERPTSARSRRRTRRGPRTDGHGTEEHGVEGTESVDEPSAEAPATAGADEGDDAAGEHVPGSGAHDGGPKRPRRRRRRGPRPATPSA
ncbi:DEAD/DEAH box helicase [Amnibacterium sp. CER49]|uniref:DEAD/DEAH box helicase n=1 Tax=Amnibacterium sp. CER49 TaxID=3039161 RepID=UPI0024479C1D|nr:DEAD/DEAH box helicase [Amnibacterium sp. CER49]MDH2445319.1 DEAD/DEAH box helicase [Amnibacterium sp. CER49]